MAKPEPCTPDCSAIVQTVIVEVPEDALRSAPPPGLALTLTLDNGFSFPVIANEAYVRGYLEAVDAGS